MNAWRGALALAGLLVCHPHAEAQVLAYPVFGGARFAYSSRGLSVVGTFGNPYAGWGLSPLSVYPAVIPSVALGPRVTVYFSPPPMWTSPPVVVRQTVVVVPERRAEVRDDDEFIRIVPRADRKRLAPAKPDAEENGRMAPMPGMPRGNFRPIEPNDRARAEQKVAPKLGQRPEPEAKPAARSAVFMAEGRAAFQAQMYGRAERLFECAANAAPADPATPFLLAQARFALRKYREAVRAIETGLRAVPNWPGTPFRPTELYGADAADFNSHLKHLEETLAKNPADPALLFLFGYELWFAGRLPEARAAFERAAKVAPDKTFIDLFLKAQAAQPVAKRN